MIRLRLVTIAVAVSAEAVVVAGCGSSGSGELSGDVALYRPTGTGSDMAQLEGRLLRAGGCTYVETSGGERVLPVFPDDAVWSDDVLQVDGAGYRLGEQVSLTGGVASGDFGDYVPSGCVEGVERWVVGR
jgi:hypothetical protein